MLKKDTEKDTRRLRDRSNTVKIAVVYRLNLILITIPITFFSVLKINFIWKHNFRKAKYSYLEITVLGVSHTCTQIQQGSGKNLTLDQWKTISESRNELLWQRFKNIHWERKVITSSTHVATLSPLQYSDTRFTSPALSKNKIKMDQIFIITYKSQSTKTSSNCHRQEFKKQAQLSENIFSSSIGNSLKRTSITRCVLFLFVS